MADRRIELRTDARVIVQIEAGLEGLTEQEICVLLKACRKETLGTIACDTPVGVKVRVSLFKIEPAYPTLHFGISKVKS